MHNHNHNNDDNNSNVTNNDHNNIDNYDNNDNNNGYFIRIKIIKLYKRLDFPSTSRINEETGVRDFINEMDNQIICVDYTIP